MMRKIIPYNPKLKERAKYLRKNMTFSEVLLWNELKNKKIQNIDFDRQRPLLNYIVDFYSKELNMAIEIDGSSHNEREEEDSLRQMELEKEGVKFLRFLDSDVKYNLAGVYKSIELYIIEELKNK